MLSDRQLIWFFIAGVLSGLALAAVGYSTYQEFRILRYLHRRRGRSQTKTRDPAE